jgi:hypothetical protein
MAQSLEVSEDALKLMVAEHGVRGTARLLGMDERQTDTFRQRVTRGKWLSDPAIATMRAKSVRPTVPVVAALSPHAALAAEIAALGGKSRLSLARGVSKAAEHIESMKGVDILDRSGDVKAVAQTADLVHGWKDAAPQVKIRLDVLGGNTESQIVDVEASAEPIVSDSDSWNNELDSY